MSESCSTHAVVEPTDRLWIPHRKRLAHAYVTTEAGGRELSIYYGSKEVTFDEERLFPFGEQLVSQSSFVAETATTWGPGYDWPLVRALLEALVDEGIVQRAEGAEDPRGTGLVPSRLPPATCRAPRAWSAAECEAITRDLGGRAIEIGNLEAVVPPYRIPHAALDADGRQVGEANVFPPGLRLDRDTEWRVCQYPGSRYRDAAPMNVTALRAMIKHWKPMMKTILELRAEVLRRLERSRTGWTTGDLHTFSRVALSVPAYQLMLEGGVAPQPPLHPVLSSMFRIVDGIRMTTHDMLALSAERTRQPGEPIDATALYGFAERNGLFLSEFGVCAGPRAMMEELFTTVFDGTPASSEHVALPGEVEALLSRLPAAVDYGLLGLQVWAVSRSVWLAMRCAHEVLLDVLQQEPAAEAAPLRAALRAGWATMKRERIAEDGELLVHRTLYADAYAQAWRGLRAPLGPPVLADRIAPAPETCVHRAAAALLRGSIGQELRGLSGAGVERITSALVHYLREEQAILASIAELQTAINALLERPPAHRPLTVRDLHVIFVLHSPPISEFPYLFDVLEPSLGLRVECTADEVSITPRRAG